MFLVASCVRCLHDNCFSLLTSVDITCKDYDLLWQYSTPWKSVPAWGNFYAAEVYCRGQYSVQRKSAPAGGNILHCRKMLQNVPLQGAIFYTADSAPARVNFLHCRKVPLQRQCSMLQKCPCRGRYSTLNFIAFGIVGTQALHVWLCSDFSWHFAELILLNKTIEWAILVSETIYCMYTVGNPRCKYIEATPATGGGRLSLTVQVCAMCVEYAR